MRMCAPLSKAILLALALAGLAAGSKEEEFNYIHHDHPATIALMEQVHQKCPDISRLYNLTETSVEGRELLVIELTENPGKHIPGKPEFKYVGNMHGNEVVGKELLLRLMVYLCDEYLSGNELVTYLLQKTRLHILPTMNPDGWQKAYEELQKNGTVQWLTGRSNANNVDLNRNFPDLNNEMYKHETSGTGRNNHLLKLQKVLEVNKDLQPETRAIMKWLASIGFVLSSNLHGGDLVANYPYDETRSGSSQQYTASPDDVNFIYLAKAYSYFHAEMADRDRKPCDKMGGDTFEDGITNGGAWYSVGRGMQDYNYLETNCFEITLELGCEKFPPESKLMGLWEDNAVALVNFMLQSHIGIKGTVKNTAGEPIADAEVKIRNLSTGEPVEHDILSLEAGDYYRLLEDGSYEVTVAAKGYHPAKQCVTVENDMYVGSGITQEAQVVDFKLTPEAEKKPDEAEVTAECQLIVDGQSAEVDNADAEEKRKGPENLALTEAEERQVLLEVLAYMDQRINWAGLGPQMGLSDLYYTLAMKLSQLDSKIHDEFLELLPPQMREHLLQSQQ